MKIIDTAGNRIDYDNHAVYGKHTCPPWFDHELYWYPCGGFPGEKIQEAHYSSIGEMKDDQDRGQVLFLRDMTNEPGRSWYLIYVTD